jgi:fermentation-respiration switch protein FrsA (DUF1100 family)
VSDRRTSLSTVLSIVMLVAVGYAAVLLAAFTFQSRLVYFPNVPSRAVGPGPDSIGLAYESVEILTEDGIRLDAWYVPVREPRGIVLFFHGNAGNISHRLDSLRVFNELNLATLIFDYRGYGRSEGFVSVPDMAAEIYPWLPARWLARIGFPTGDVLPSVTCPVLVVHSRGDEIIPFGQGSRLFEVAREPKQFLELRGGHNDGFLVSGRRYLDGLDTFVATSLGE